MTKECPAGEEIKKALAENYGELDTYIGLHPYKNDTRFVLNSLMKEVAALEAAGEPFEKVAPLVAGYRTRKFTQGGKDLDEGSLCIGEDIGLIRDVPSVEELISGMMAECEAQLGRFN